MIKYKGLKLEEDVVKDILTTAIEGGISYWACLGNDDKHWIEQSKLYKEKTGECPYYCDTALNVMLNGYAVILYDEEDDNGEFYFESEEDLNYSNTGININNEIYFF